MVVKKKKKTNGLVIAELKLTRCFVKVYWGGKNCAGSWI